MTTELLPGRPALDGRGDEAYLRGFWNFLQRNRFLLLGITALVVAATGVFVWRATPIYEASTSIRIDEDQSTIPVLDALKTLSSGSQIGTEMEVLRSRTLAEDVVEELALGVSLLAPRRTARDEVFSAVTTQRSAPPGRYRLSRGADGTFVAVDEGSGRELVRVAPGQALALPGVALTLSPRAARFKEIELKVAPFEDAVRALRLALTISQPNREAELLLARYEGADPVLVRAVPNALARAFIDRRQQTRGTEARSTVAFLRAQLDSITGQLAASEDAVRRYREQQRLISPEAEARADVARLVELRAERDGIAAERDALVQLLDEVHAMPAVGPTQPSPMRRLVAFPTLLKNPATAQLLGSLADVENKRAELLTRRTWDDPDVAILSDRVHALEAQLGTIASTYARGLGTQLTALDTQLVAFGGQLQRVPQTEVTLARLERQPKVLAEVYTMLQTRLKEAQIAAAVEDPSVRVIDPAILPTRPIRPNIPLSLGMALLLGLVLSAGAAFAREHLDTSVRTRDDLRLALAGAPVLGTIPRMREAHALEGARWRLRGRTPAMNGNGWAARLETARDPGGAVSEAYRSLRTNLAFARPGTAVRVVVLTSPNPGEGKSTSAANLATSLAQQGVRCLLVDADLRRGALHELLRGPREPGLSDVLVGRARFDDGVQAVTPNGGPGFAFLPAGTAPPNPAELLGSPHMRGLLDRLRTDYDFVLLDAPPLNLVTDAALLGTQADGVIVVARAGVTERGALRHTLDQLQAVRAPVLGAILNDVDQRKDRYYGGYGTATHYGHDAIV